ncbi:unnamed protein product [Diamesa hyperborea]
MSEPNSIKDNKPTNTNMQEEGNFQPTVNMEPVHTNGMVIYGYSGSPNPQFNQQYGRPNMNQQYSPRPPQFTGNYVRVPPRLATDIPFLYKPTIAEYFAKNYTLQAYRPLPTFES